eukprot:9905780-Ditylum_brightwellii.AAC.1
MPSKINYNKKSIHFKLVMGNKYQKTLPHVSKIYNREDKINETKINETFKQALITYLKLVTWKQLVDEET